MSAAGTSLVDTLTDLLAQGKMGALDLQEGKKRWRYYVDGGALVGSLSNLKSEQVDTLAAAHPGVGAPEIAKMVTVRRLRRGADAILGGATVGWHEGMSPKSPVALKTASVMGEAFGDAFDAGQIESEVPASPFDDIASLINNALTDSGEASASSPTSPGPAVDAFVEVRRACRRITESVDHFAVFGLTFEATPEQIRVSYLELAQALHPDHLVGVPTELHDQVTAAFDRVNGAWEVLESETKRAAYIRHEIQGELTEDQATMEQVEAYFDGEAAFRKGMGAFQAGRLVQAHAFFGEATANAPDELEFRAYHGFTTYKMNRKTDRAVAKAGIKTIHEVIEANKKQSRKLDGAWVLLGRIYREEEHLDRAKTCMIQALKLNPANPDARRGLRRIKDLESEKSSAKGGILGSIFGKKKR